MGMAKRCSAVFLVLLLMGLAPLGTLAAPPEEDGQYTVEVSLSGGTGRASITSPAPLSVAGGVMTATLEWSSPYYEYMLVDGVQYDPVQTEGNSTFTIPVRLDEDMPVTAQTIAMSEPHEIDYVLYFDSSTLASVGRKAFPAGRVVLIIAIVCVAVVVLILVTRKRKKGGAP